VRAAEAITQGSREAMRAHATLQPGGWLGRSGLLALRKFPDTAEERHSSRCEIADGLPLSAFPTRQRARIHADVPGRLPLRNPERFPTLNQPLCPAVPLAPIKQRKSAMIVPGWASS
jgi:hypothetical protein